MDEPLLEADGARITVDGRPAFDGLTVRSRGTRVLAVGDWSPLVATLGALPVGSAGGRAELASGSLRIAGADAARGEHFALCGIAPSQLPLPPKLTLRAYLSWAGRLANLGRGAARARADAVMAQLGLAAQAGRKLGDQSSTERRVARLAQAIVGDPAVVVLDHPFDELDEAVTEPMSDLVARICDGRSALVTTGRLSSSSPALTLARSASQVLVLHDGELALDTEPQALFEEVSLYAVTVAEGATELAEALRNAGSELHGGPRRFAARLPPGSSARAILEAAHSSGAVVTGCEPLWG